MPLPQAVVSLYIKGDLTVSTALSYKTLSELFLCSALHNTPSSTGPALTLTHHRRNEQRLTYSSTFQFGLSNQSLNCACSVARAAKSRAFQNKPIILKLIPSMFTQRKHCKDFCKEKNLNRSPVNLRWKHCFLFSTFIV